MKRDAGLVGGTVLLTCVALMSYNYHLLLRVRRKERAAAVAEEGGGVEYRGVRRRRARFSPRLLDRGEAETPVSVAPDVQFGPRVPAP